MFEKVALRTRRQGTFFTLGVFAGSTGRPCSGAMFTGMFCFFWLLRFRIMCWWCLSLEILNALVLQEQVQAVFNLVFVATDNVMCESRISPSKSLIQNHYLFILFTCPRILLEIRIKTIVPMLSDLPCASHKVIIIQLCIYYFCTFGPLPSSMLFNELKNYRVFLLFPWTCAYGYALFSVFYSFPVNTHHPLIKYI